MVTGSIQSLADIGENPRYSLPILLRHRLPRQLLGALGRIGNGTSVQGKASVIAKIAQFPKNRLIRLAKRCILTHQTRNDHAIGPVLLIGFHRPKRLRPHRVGAPVPELPAVERRIEQRGRVATCLADSAGESTPICKTLIRGMTTGAGNLAIYRHAGVKEEKLTELCRCRVVRVRV